MLLHSNLIEKIFLPEIYKVIFPTVEKIRDEKEQNGVNRETAKISVLSSD